MLANLPLERTGDEPPGHGPTHRTTVSLNRIVAPDAVRQTTWETLQGALDVHAAKTRSPLATRSGDHEFLCRQATT
jgi:hypothetical protein